MYICIHVYLFIVIIIIVMMINVIIIIIIIIIINIIIIVIIIIIVLLGDFNAGSRLGAGSSELHGRLSGALDQAYHYYRCLQNKRRLQEHTLQLSTPFPPSMDWRAK